MGVPASTDYMLRFVDTVRKDIRPDMIGPIVVHCRYFFLNSCCIVCSAMHIYFIIDLRLMCSESVIVV